MTDRTSSWKPLDFRCPYDCIYCPECRSPDYNIEPELRKDWRDVPYRKTGIWVCGDTDLFHPEVPDYIIDAVLSRARDHPSHCYIFCTKNPQRYIDFLGKFPGWSYFTATIETDVDYGNSLSPPPLERLRAMKELRRKLERSSKLRPNEYQLTISMQPTWDFTDEFYWELTEIQPDQVCIGRVVGDYKYVQEPDFGKLMKLARRLSKMAVNRPNTPHTICMVNIDGRHVNSRSRFRSWPWRDPLSYG